jgi:hypothetical protein
VNPEELASDLDQFSGEAQPPEVQRRVAAAGHDQVEAVRSAPDEGRQLAQCVGIDQLVDVVDDQDVRLGDVVEHVHEGRDDDVGVAAHQHAAEVVCTGPVEHARRRQGGDDSRPEALPVVVGAVERHPGHGTPRHLPPSP